MKRKKKNFTISDYYSWCIDIALKHSEEINMSKKITLELHKDGN